jgi:curved DNA-binding protein CbpA
MQRYEKGIRRMTSKSATHYEVLGIPIDALKKDTKLAYRELSKLHHPDKNGGDDAKFKTIAEAYRILSDELLREEYDRTGQNLSAKSIQALAIEQLVMSFTQLIQQKVPKGGNPLTVLEEFMGKTIVETDVKIKKLITEIKRLKDIKSRIKYKKRKGECYFTIRLKQLIQDLEGQTAKLRRDKKVFIRAKSLLKDHSYNVEPQDYISQPRIMIRGTAFLRAFSRTSSNTTASSTRA